MKIYGQVKIFIIFFFLLFLCQSATATEATSVINNPQYFIRLDAATIAKGYTVSAFDDAFKLSLVSGVLSTSTGVRVEDIMENIPSPWHLDRISKIYQFDFVNTESYDNHKPFFIQFSYATSTDNLKQVYFYDKNTEGWRPLPTTDFPEQKFVRSLIHLPYARLAVFDNPKILTVGKASWYKYKGGNFAASPDFPKGSVLRVTNLSNGKAVDVTVNDFGPNRVLHPDRVVDLDKIAFGKISPLSAGTIKIKVEPLRIASDKDDVLKMSSVSVGPKPEISSLSAVVMDEETNKILFGKNASSTLPIASLSKLIAIKTFLNTDPDIKSVVSYSVKDEENNYQYVDYKWEVARVKLKDGDKLTIEDLIYSALVGSANNAVETLARVSGFTRSDFIQKMNDLVKEWGASSTSFIDPAGLSPENVSSAADYAIIFKEALRDPLIAKSSQTAQYEFTTINTKQKHTIRNTNQLIRINQYNITGSKTGFLYEAGYCLATRAKDKNGRQIITVLLNSSGKAKSFSETEDLLDYGFRQKLND